MAVNFRWIVSIVLILLVSFYLGFTFLYGNNGGRPLQQAQVEEFEKTLHLTKHNLETQEKQGTLLQEAITVFRQGVEELKELFKQSEEEQTKILKDTSNTFEVLQESTEELASEQEKLRTDLKQNLIDAIKDQEQRFKNDLIESIADEQLNLEDFKHELIEEIKSILADKGDGVKAAANVVSSADDCSMLNQLLIDKRFPPIALASFPRSGSSWTRHILESSTGVATGAIYYDFQIQKSYLPAEGMMEGVLVIKTHEMNTTLEDWRISTKRKQNLPIPAVESPVLVKSLGAIVLVRNPFDAIESQFQLYRSGIHTSIQEQLDPVAWNRHVNWAVGEWEKFYRYWTLEATKDGYPVIVVRYEDLQSHPEQELRRMLNFLDFKIDEKRMRCAIEATKCENQQHICRRGKMGASLKYFSPEHRQLVIDKVGFFMNRFGYDTKVPMQWEEPPSRLFTTPSTTPKVGPEQPCAHRDKVDNSVLMKNLRQKQEAWKETLDEDETIEEKLKRLRNPPVILMWISGGWHGWGQTGYNDYAGIDMKKPQPKCLWTRNRAYLRNSSIVLFEPPGHVHRFGKEWCANEYPFPEKRYRWQKWVEFDYEGENQFPILGAKEFMDVFDYEISWRDNAHFKLSLNCPTAANRTFLDVAPPKKKREALATYFATRCQARERDEYVRQLMKFIKVDSFGSCLHNANMDDEKAGAWPRNWQLKVDTMGQYKFALTFENDNFTSWVTEKMPHAVMAGTVPIYMGADNVDRFAPGPHSIIKVSDFSGPQELAEYLKMLDENDDLYNEYYAWKQTGKVSPGFQAHYDSCAYYTDIRICDEVLAEQEEELKRLLNMLERSDEPIYRQWRERQKRLEAKKLLEEAEQEQQTRQGEEKGEEQEGRQEEPPQQQQQQQQQQRRTKSRARSPSKRVIGGKMHS